VAESDRLAQANLSRPGESYRGSPKCFPREESPRRPTVRFGRASERLA